MYSSEGFEARSMSGLGHQIDEFFRSESHLITEIISVNHETTNNGYFTALIVYKTVS